MNHPFLRAVIFDLDGTLIDSAHDITHAVNLMLTEQDIQPLSVEIVQPMIGEGVMMLMKKVLVATGIVAPNEAMLVHCATRYRHFYATYPTMYTAVYDGVLEVLASLHTEGYQLGLCTNKPHAITRIVLEALHLAQYFTVVVGGESTPFRKPDAYPLWSVIAQMKVERKACVYVGDSEVDVATARNAGVRLVLVSYGYAQVAVAKLEAEARIESFRILPAVLAGLADNTPILFPA